IGDGLVGHVASEHVQGGRLAVVEGDVPVLDADRLPAVDGRVVFADVPGRVDALDGGLKAGAAADSTSLADREPRSAGERDVGGDTRAHDHGFGVECEAAAGDDARDALLALEALELVAAVDPHAVLPEQLLKEPSGGRAEAAFE